MNTRLEQIHARLDAWREMRHPQPSTAALVDDVEWLLARLEAQKSMADEFRFELDRLRVRIAQGHNDRA
jgi:hypothetical protein